MMALALLPLGAALWLGFESGIWWPLAGLLGMSLLTLLAYAWDKQQAMLGGWRVPEARLHLLELCGGWPGALIARQWLRHKTQKGSYRLRFWVIVWGQLLLLGLWFSRPLWLS